MTAGRRVRTRRATARLVVVALAATGLNGLVALSTRDTAAAGTLLFSQAFRTNTADPASPVSIPTLPGGATNAVCLTSVGNTAGALPRSCTAGTSPNGSGKLRFTDTATTKTGGLFGATSVPTSQGLDATFTIYQYGAGGADGMAFVLGAVDPAAPTAPAFIGPSGGSLGYSSFGGLSGLDNAYLGVGFDTWGTFSVSSYQGSGCVNPPYIGAARVPGQVVIRGPGRGSTGYCAVNSTATTTTSPALALRASTRAAAAIPVEVAINPTSSSLTTASGIVVPPNQYRVAFTPVGGAPRTLQGALPTVPSTLYPSASWLNPNGIPKQLAFGWVGSTGSVADYHEVDLVSVTSFNPVPQLAVAATSFVAAAPAAGDPVTYAVTAGVEPGADETQPVSVTETLPAGTVALGAYGTGWVCGTPSGRTVSCAHTAGTVANGTSLPAITVVGIVVASGVTAGTVAGGTVSTASSADANPGYAATAPNGTVAGTPTGIALDPTLGPAAGGTTVTVTGSAVTGATAVLVGTAAQLAGGTPTTLLPCTGGQVTGCFTQAGNGTITVPAMPAHATGPVLVDVVTRGVAGSATYTYVAVPGTPAKPTAVAGTTSAAVTWVAPADNSSPITGYVVTPHLGGVAQAPVSYDASSVTRTVGGLTAGGSYTFTVAAVNAVGTGAASPLSSAVVPYTVPAAPTVTSVVTGTSSATVAFTTPASGSSPITGYVITPYVGNTAQAPQAFTGTGTSRVVTGLTPGTAYTFTVAATNAAGTGPPSARSGAATPNPHPALANPAAPAGEVGVAYSDQLTATGGTTPYGWSVSAGTLPAGITLNASTGLLSGTPTAAGTYPFTVRVTDASGATATQSLSIAVAAAPTLTFPAPPAGQVGIAYHVQLTVTGGTGPFGWSVPAGALPPGVTLNASTGLLSGTPTAAGTSSFTVRVTDSFGQVANRTVGLVVAARPTLANPPPAAGRIGLAYSEQLAVTGGTGPYAWAVTAGSLPAGITLNPSSGALSGTPAAAGTSAFTVQVTDANGQSAAQSLTLTVGVGPLVVAATSSVATTAPGGTVRFTVTVTNTSTVAYAGVSFSQPLAGVLDDATYSGDVTATRGVATVASGTLSWTGDLPAGAVATVAHTVSVLDPDPGDRILTGSVTSPTLGTTCPADGTDPRCSVSVPVSVLRIVTTPSVATSTPGGVVGYQIVVTNTGQVAVPAAALSTSLAGVLDDALYAGDATATGGAVSYTSPTLSWTGALAIGASATISFSVTVSQPDTGNLVLANTVVSGAAGSTCPVGGTDTACTATVTVLVPALSITNTADLSSTTPGSTVGYTLTVANTGQTPYAGITVTDALAGVLDDATYGADATATAGAVSVAGSTLSWTGDLAVGGTVTVTFSVLVRTPDGGDRTLTAVATSAAAGSSCPTGTPAGCTSRVPVLVPALTIAKTADVASATPGATVRYTVTVTNSGQTPYTGTTVTDVLTGVLDDAGYGNDATATAGTVSYAAPTLTWTGGLAVDAVATITYSVAVAAPDTGDRSLVNTARSEAAGSSCPAAAPGAGCTSTVPVLVPGLTLGVVPDRPSAIPGSVVDFVLTATNSGETAYAGATFRLSLVEGLDDATYNNDIVIVGPGNVVAHPDGTADWTGDLAIGQSVTLSGSVTVSSPAAGDRLLGISVTSATAGSTCPTADAAPACSTTVTVLIPGLVITKTADAATTVPGGAISYTITAANTGQSAYTGAAFTDPLANVLVDAVWNGDAAASTGTVSYAAPTLSWTGDLAVGATATITFSVTVRDPDPGDKFVLNTVASTTPGSNCPAGGTDPRCTAAVTVLVPGLTVVTGTDVASTTAGGTVGHTITVTNSGQTPLTGVTVTDALAGVLDDAGYGGDATATSGAASFAGSTVTWTGNLAVGAVATITYSVSVHASATGDGVLTGIASSPVAGGNCLPGSVDERCTSRVTVSALSVVSTADVETTTPGGQVRFTSVFTNTGRTPYPGIVVVLDAGGSFDDAVSNGDQSVTSGTLVLGPDALEWTGDIPVGGSVTASGSFTVNDPDQGDHSLTSVLSSAAPGSTCPTGAEPGCTTSVPVRTPGLSIVTTANVSTTTPGSTVAFTVTLTSGETAYRGAVVTIPLSGLTGDSVYSGDVAGGSGVVSSAGSGSGQVLTWTGDLAAAQVVTVTYSVVVRNPDPGGKVLVARVSSTVVGSSCPPAGGNAGCAVTVAVLTPALTITHTADRTTATPGRVLLHTVVVTNSGQTSRAAAFTLALSGVLDDAAYTGAATATAGTVGYAAPTLSWSGTLAPTAAATIVYRVTVDDPDLGDRSMIGTVVSATTGNNCPAGGTDPRCTATVAGVDAATLSFRISTAAPTATVGQVVDYSVVVTNSGGSAYADPAVTGDLAGVLDDAAYAGGVATTAGTVDITGSTLTWSAASVPAGGTVTITFAVTVTAPGGGDRLLTSALDSSSPGNNCAAAGTDPRCGSRVTVSALLIAYAASVAATTPGSVFRLTATFTNTGTTPYLGILVSAPATDSLDDVTPNGDQTASSGTLVVGAGGVSWTGDIPVGGTVTITGTVTVKNPDPGNRSIVARVQTTAPGSNCPPASTDPSCFFTVPVLLPGLSVVTAAPGGPVTTPGSPVAFTVTIDNTGGTAYSDAEVTIPLSGLVGDSVYADDAAAGSGVVVSSGSGAAQVLTWTGDLLAGSVVTVSYSVVVRDPDPGGKVLVARASAMEAGSSCPPASGNAGCSVTVAVLTPGLTITHTAGAPSAVAGATVTFTTVIANTGQTPYAGVVVTQSLAGVLDDATFAGATATTGAVGHTTPTVTWTGDLAPGASGTVTVTVTVAGGAGDRTLTSTVASAADGGNCPPGGTDPRCTAAVTVTELTFLNTADTTTAAPGDRVRFTVTITNTGATPLVDISADDIFVGALDDAVYTGDATASAGTLVLVPGSGKVVWTGDLAPGAVSVVTGSLVVRSPDPGDRSLSTLVRSAAPGGNCPAGGTDPRCTAVVDVLTPGLSITKTADAGTVTPGDTVGYTIVLTNTGETPYAGAVVTDQLAAVLTDAVYDGDATATTGTVSVTGATLSWTGDLALAATVIIGYSVTVRSPDPGDKLMVNRVTSEAIGSTCPAAGPAAACTASVVVLVPRLTITKAVDATTATPGDPVGYTIVVTNDGQTPYAGIAVTDALTGVLDDAEYAGDAAATSGTVSVTGSTLTWTGDLPVDGTATITYSVAVRAAGGDGQLVDAVTSTARDNTCPVGGTDPRCTTTVTVLVPGLVFGTIADRPSVSPGGRVRFTVTATNSGDTPYPGLSFTSSLAGVLDDAVLDGVATATSGVLAYPAPDLTWTGSLAPGASVTVTYTVVVRSPDPGDRSLVGVVTSAARGSSCPPPGTAAGCAVTVAVLLPAVAVTLEADVTTTTPGSTVGYMLTATNTGETAFPTVTVTVPLGGVLDDADGTGDEAASSGTVSVSGGTLSWTGALAVGAAAEITFSVVVSDPDPGDKVLLATARSDAAGSSCPAGSPGPSCSSSVTVLVPALSIVATADRSEVVAGNPVLHTVTVTNTGQTPYAGSTVRVDLTGSLDDGVYGGDGTADTGSVAYAEPVLTWTGDLAVGATATLAYTVEVALPVTGDGAVVGVAGSTAAGSSCPPPGSAAGCTVTVAVLVPALAITKTALTDTVVSGDRVGYRIVVLNTGPSPYAGASFSDSLAGVLDDATYNGDAVATAGTVSFAAGVVTWVGSLPAAGSATVTYSVSVVDPDPGDRSLVNVVSSDTPGSNCPAGSTEEGCRTTTPVTPQSLTLSDLTGSFGLAGAPGRRGTGWSGPVR